MYPYVTWPWHISGIYLDLVVGKILDQNQHTDRWNSNSNCQTHGGAKFGGPRICSWFGEGSVRTTSVIRGIFSENRDKEWFKMFSGCVFAMLFSRKISTDGISIKFIILYTAILWLKIETLPYIILTTHTLLALVSISIWNLSAYTSKVQFTLLPTVTPMAVWPLLQSRKGPRGERDQ